MSDPTVEGTAHPGRLRHKNRIWAEQVLTRSTRLRALSVWMQSRSNGDDKNLVILRTAMPFDIFLIQFVGLVAAAVSGATSLHRMEATPVPFSLPIALTVLKLPTTTASPGAAKHVHRGKAPAGRRPGPMGNRPVDQVAAQAS